jgi:ABC-type amino acid transport substrate-binding protein
MASLFIRLAVIIVVSGATLSQYVDQQGSFGVSISTHNPPSPTITFQEIISPASQINYSSSSPSSGVATFQEQPSPYSYQQPVGQLQQSVSQVSSPLYGADLQPNYANPTNYIASPYQANPFYQPYLNQQPYQVPQPYAPYQFPPAQLNYVSSNISSPYPYPSYPAPYSPPQPAYPMYAPQPYMTPSLVPPQTYGPQVYSVQSFIPAPFVPALQSYVPYQPSALQVPQNQMSLQQQGPSAVQNQVPSQQPGASVLSASYVTQNQVFPQQQFPQAPLGYSAPSTPAPQVFQLPQPVFTAVTTSTNSITANPSDTTDAARAQPVQANKPHFRVLGTPANLFLTVNNNSSVPAYSGLVIDLLNALASIAEFTYAFGVQPDQQYGSQAADGSWNGLVRSLIDGKADIAAADLSITSDREAVLDFTVPFHQYSMAMLVNKQYGANGNGVTYLIRNNADTSFLKYSPAPQDQAIWANITRNYANSVVESDNEGIQRAVSGPYAFILESANVNYALNISNGLLEKSAHVFQPRHLAFAVQQGSPIREKLSWAIIKLQENGQLQSIVKKYFKAYP